MDDSAEWIPAIEKPRSAYGRVEVLFHLLLPTASLLLGLSLWLGFLTYADTDAGRQDAPLNFAVAVVFTGLGGLELLVWRHRLRRLKGPSLDAAE